MAKFVFGMNQSLDGYVDHTKFRPTPTLFRHFIEQTRTNAGSLYGRRLYEIMSYWDEDKDGWDADEHAYAAAWRRSPKWVVSRSLTSVGPNATLIKGDLEPALRRIKQEVEGVVDVGGPVLAKSVIDLGLIDEYCIYVHPVVLGSGSPFFVGPRPPLRLVGSERMDGDVIRLTYVPGPASSESKA